MTYPKSEEIDEARSWGRSLIVSGFLVIILVLTSTNNWGDLALFIGMGIAMVWGGWGLCRYSDQAHSKASDSRE